ncbi:MAG TPA: ATP-dependent DNA ligase [Terriglobales bacterium]|nr:ATP-dependent DNA ligase [Terriglobales bacterium]
MQALATVAEAIGGTAKKTEKVRLLAEYFRSRSTDEAATSAVFLSGRAFPAWEEVTLQVGGAQLWRVIGTLAQKSDALLSAAYRRHGDLGAAAYDVLRSGAPAKGTLTVLQVAEAFRAIARASGPAAKSALIIGLLGRTTALEAKYLVKIITGELRIGLKENLVEEAIARAHDATPAEVQRANMLLGDIGKTLRLAVAGRLAEAHLRIFHPIGFMLASPVENAEEAFTYFDHAAVEDKYDGIRAQAHIGEAGIRLFSRTLDEVTESFPELVAPLNAFAETLVLDGEIVAWDAAEHRALPFSELQKRLGRKKVSEKLQREVPVAYIVFDVLYAGDELVIDRPLRERGALFDRVFAAARRPFTVGTGGVQGRLRFEPAVEAHADANPPAQVIRAPVAAADSPQHLAEMFEKARERGNEGLMIKDLQSPYTPGRRGRAWLKLKRELATLDVVVTAVEWGHGKRARVLSDYTFAVRDGDKLLNVGKAYSGLTDTEIARMTTWFLEHTLADQGFVRMVEPKVVLEVAFNAVMRSDRHESGFALRFPRILRLRDDKAPDEIDTLEMVKEIYERQRSRQGA